MYDLQAQHDKSDLIADLRKSGSPIPDHLLAWEQEHINDQTLLTCNAGATRVFRMCKMHFQAGLHRAIYTGFDPADIRLACDALGVSLTSDLLTDLRVMEAAVCTALNGRSEDVSA